MAEPNVVLRDDLLERAQVRATAEGKSVDELADEAMERLLAERVLAKFRREGALRRQGMSDDQVSAIVDRAIRETRDEARGH